VSYKHVQAKLDVDTYLNLIEYTTLHSVSIDRAINSAVKEFLNKEMSQNECKDTRKS